MKIKPIDWSDEVQPNDVCGYNHVNGDTHLGSTLITWKGWKDSPSYDIEQESYGWIGSEISLESAKEAAWKHHQEVILKCIEV